MSGRKHTEVRFSSGWNGDSLARQMEARAERVARDAERRCQDIERAALKREQGFFREIGKLERVQQSFFDGMDVQLAQMRGEHRLALAQQEERLTRAIEAQGRELARRIGQLESTCADARQTAEFILGAVEAELAYVQANYLHDLFCPGEVGLVAERAALARQDLSRGHASSALPLAQESLLQTRRLHTRLELMQRRWEALRAEALARLESVSELVRQHDKFRLCVEGNAAETMPPPPPCDTDYWSEGAFKTLLRELDERREAISRDGAVARMEDLEEATSFAESTPKALEEIVRRAYDTALSSIQRADLQAAFYERLRDAGYTMEDNAWFAGDERRANHLIMRGVNGDRIAIIVRPSGYGETQGNQVEVDFHEPAPSEIRRRERLEVLRQAMSETYGAPQEWVALPGAEWDRNAPETCFDLAQVRAGKVDHVTS